jgi:GxxExxY protein
MNKLLYKDLVYDVVGCAMDVHSELGSGFLEAVYEEALCIVLEKKNIPFELQKRLKIKFQGEFLKSEYVADLVVYNKIIVELKAVSNLKDVYTAQVLNYLKATGLNVGLLINFGGDSLFWKRYALSH